MFDQETIIQPMSKALVGDYRQMEYAGGNELLKLQYQKIVQRELRLKTPTHLHRPTTIPLRHALKKV